MAISDSIGRARAARTPLQGARLMARLEHEISEDLTASEEWHAAADRAIDEQRVQFPTARTLDAYLEPPPSSSAGRAGLRDWPPRDDRPLRRRRTACHALEAAGVFAALAGAVALVVRHVRRHPRHAVTGPVVVAIATVDRPRSSPRARSQQWCGSRVAVLELFHALPGCRARLGRSLRPGRPLRRAGRNGLGEPARSARRASRSDGRTRPAQPGPAARTRSGGRAAGEALSRQKLNQGTDQTAWRESPKGPTTSENKLWMSVDDVPMPSGNCASQRCWRRLLRGQLTRPRRPRLEPDMAAA